MASRRKRTRADGTVYYVWRGQVRLTNGKLKEKTFRTKGEATAWEVAQKAEIQKGTWFDPDRGKVSLDQWLGTWSKGRTIKAATRNRDESLISNYISPEFGASPIRTIEREEVKAWAVALEQEHHLKPQAAQKCVDIFKAVMQEAVESNRIPFNPVQGVSIKGGTKSVREAVYLKMPEAMKVAQAMPERFEVLALTGFLTGMRPGEIFGLRRNRILEPNGLLPWRIKIDSTVVEVQGQLGTGEPKSDSSRTISIPKYLADRLDEHCNKYGVSGDGLVFTNETGGPISRTAFRKMLARRSQVAIGTAMTTYDFRHSHAAMLIWEGEHPKVISARLGHSSIRTTFDVYGGLFKDYDVGAVDALQTAVLLTLVEDSVEPDLEAKSA